MNNENKKKNNYYFKLHEVIIMVVATCFLSFFAGSTIMELKMNRNGNSTYNKDSIKDKNIKKFIDNYEYILENYYKDIDEDKLINGAIEGMMGILDDPYTAYMDDNDSESFNILLNGSYRGLGIEIGQGIDNKLYIVGIIANSPASNSGLKPGDILIGINDVDVSNYSTKEVSNLILNNDIKEFNIKVIRDGETKDFVVDKEYVLLESVDSAIYEKNNHKIGYIYISLFAANTDEQFSEELARLEKENIDSLIIDVRSNNGGHLDTAEKISSMFVDDSYTIYKLKKNGKTKSYKSKGEETKKYPIVVLVNSSSASASELLTGCLKDNLKATVIGEKTFGKGLVQELVVLSNGDQYKITTKEWLTPNGTSVNGVGIAPDIEVSLSDNFYNDPKEENDNQLQEAINYLAK